MSAVYGIVISIKGTHTIYAQYACAYRYHHSNHRLYSYLSEIGNFVGISDLRWALGHIMITNKLKFHNRMIVSPFFQLDLRSARSMYPKKFPRAINIMLTYSENSAGALVSISNEAETDSTKTYLVSPALVAVLIVPYVSTPA